MSLTYYSFFNFPFYNCIHIHNLRTKGRVNKKVSGFVLRKRFDICVERMKFNKVSWIAVILFKVRAEEWCGNTSKMKTWGRALVLMKDGQERITTPSMEKMAWQRLNVGSESLSQRVTKCFHKNRVPRDDLKVFFVGGLLEVIINDINNLTWQITVCVCIVVLVCI